MFSFLYCFGRSYFLPEPFVKVGCRSGGRKRLDVAGFMLLRNLSLACTLSRLRQCLRILPRPKVGYGLCGGLLLIFGKGRIIKPDIIHCSRFSYVTRRGTKGFGLGKGSACLSRFLVCLSSSSGRTSTLVFYGILRFLPPIFLLGFYGLRRLSRIGSLLLYGMEGGKNSERGPTAGRKTENERGTVPPAA